jgi:hypothetical protein
MAADGRFFGPVLSSAECEAVFAGSDEAKRMGAHPQAHLRRPLQMEQ